MKYEGEYSDNKCHNKKIERMAGQVLFSFCCPLARHRSSLRSVKIMEWKPLELLTYDDLLKNPVWEHRYNNGREEVRPTNLTMINDDPNRGFIVRTRFQFANGTEAFGYSSPQDPSGLDYIQPTVMTNQGQWNIFTGEGKPSGTEKGLFPMKCESLVECEGQFWKATIDKDPTNG